MPNVSIAARKWAKRQKASAVTGRRDQRAGRRGRCASVLDLPNPAPARAATYDASHLHAPHALHGAGARGADSHHAELDFDRPGMFEIERRLDALALR